MPTETPWGQQAIKYDAREDRRMLDRLPVQPGVVAAGDLKVTPVSGLTVAVAAGDAWVLGSHAGVTRQGLYSTGLAASENVVVGAANATNPRIDQIVLRIRDSSPAPATAGDAENSGKLEVVAGTATAGATLDNRTGVGTVPASCIRLADILVPAAFTGPFVQATHIRDRRPWAFGGYVRQIAGSGADYTNTTVTAAQIDTAWSQARLECSGMPLRVILSAIVGTTNAGAIFDVYVDGSKQNMERRYSDASTRYDASPGLIWDIFPLVGSRLIDVRFWSTTAATAAVIQRGAAALPMLTLEEMIKTNAANTGA